MSIDRERYLTIAEAAKKSLYSYDHIRKLVSSGKVASLESEFKRLVDYPDLERYIAAKPQRKPHAK